MSDVDAIWDRLRELMPNHDDCGRQLQAGASPPDQLVLVCPPCSFVGIPDPGWVAAVVLQATGDVAAQAGEPNDG